MPSKRPLLAALLALSLVGLTTACLVTAPDGSVRDCRTVKVTRKVWMGPKYRRYVRRTTTVVRCTLVSGPTSTTTTTVAPPSTGAVHTVAAGYGHTCASLLGGTAQCWGSNGAGQLGNGTTDLSSVPVVVPGLTGVRQVAAGGDVSCAVLQDDTAKCWGLNTFKPIDSSEDSARYTPTDLGLTGVSSVSATSLNVCAVMLNGDLSCRGSDLYGLMNGNGPGWAPVVGAGDSAQVAITSTHACSLGVSGAVMCWGQNNHGQLGDGTSNNSATPVQVVGITNAVQVAVAEGFSCARLDGGSVKCWGDNSLGQLGNGTNTSSNVPVTVTGLAGPTPGVGVLDIAASNGRACAVNVDAVHCWGSNFVGQLGDGSTVSSNVPTTVAGFAVDGGAVNLALGDYASCARYGFAMACWGGNGYGQLGDGTLTDRHTPVWVTGHQLPI